MAKIKLIANTESYSIYNGSMLDMLEIVEPNTIDSIITDPPYELNFMNKEWDRSGIAFQKETWEKCYEVLKPGGYLLAFGGSRTHHRIACAIEDAGFEIRDTIMWLYGSGFPKSMDISKMIDKNANSNMLNVIGKWLKEKREQNNLSREKVADLLGVTSSAVYNWEENPQKYGFPTKENWNKLKQIYNFDGTWDDFKKEAEREVIGKKKVMGKDEDIIYGKFKGGEIDITLPATELAKQWQGWGTALKPAYEPIIVARKPFKGSLVDNVIKYGVGGINIDECRIETNPEIDDPRLGGNGSWKTDKAAKNVYEGGYKGVDIQSSSQGRFPANVIHDGSEEVISGFPVTNPTKSHDGDGLPLDTRNMGWGFKRMPSKIEDNGGSASRYFYCAKASKKDREEGLDMFDSKYTASAEFRPNHMEKALNGENGNPYGRWQPRKNIHPTVKPCELMQYLVRLVTPNGGIVLDPFMGSGSTGKACMFENQERQADYKFIGIDLEEEYCNIASARIDYALNKYKYDYQQKLKKAKEKGQMSLF